MQASTLIQKLSDRTGLTVAQVENFFHVYKNITKESMENLDYMVIPGIGRLVPVIQESKIMCSNLGGKRTPIRVGEKLKIKYVPEESLLRFAEQKLLSGTSELDYENIIESILK